MYFGVNYFLAYYLYFWVRDSILLTISAVGIYTIYRLIRIAELDLYNRKQQNPPRREEEEEKDDGEIPVTFRSRGRRQ